jgi:hypothetical protein
MIAEKSRRFGPLARWAAAVSAAVVLLAATPARADTAVVAAAQDATLIEDPAGAFASGSGPAVFAGRIASTLQSVRRALIRFDVAAAVPPGSVVEEVRLRLHLAQSNSGPTPASLHRVTQTWGEGASASLGGGGAASQEGDATWIHRFHDGVFWTTPGGDFDPVSHAGATLDQPGFTTFGTTPEMVADVQSWLDDPLSNAGWILLGDESRTQTAKRLDSRENPDPALQPLLEIVYAAPCAPAPLGFGAWKQACAAGLDASAAACAARTFDALGLEGIDACGAVLAAPPPSCDARAARQLSVLILNLCTNRLQTSCPVDPDGACASDNIGDLLEEIAALVAGGDCRRAASCSALPG